MTRLHGALGSSALNAAGHLHKLRSAWPQLFEPSKVMIAHVAFWAATLLYPLLYAGERQFFIFWRVFLKPYEGERLARRVPCPLQGPGSIFYL